MRFVMAVSLKQSPSCFLLYHSLEIIGWSFLWSYIRYCRCECLFLLLAFQLKNLTCFFCSLLSGVAKVTG